jgi:hypothetical protein
LRNQSAYFITFLAALFIAVPAVATLLIYEIEVVNEIPQAAAAHQASGAFKIENATFSASAPDPLQTVPPLGSVPSNAQPDRNGSSDTGAGDIHRFAGLFADAPKESGSPGTRSEAAGNAGPFAPAQSPTHVFSIRLPFSVNGKSVVVKLDQDAELHHSAAMFFIGTGLLGIAGLKRKKYRKRIRRYRKIM